MTKNDPGWLPGPIETFAALASRIREMPAPATPRLIAVDGPSGAGKSTFALRLARALGGPPIVEMDDFVSWDDLAGWWPRLERQVLHPLLEGRSAAYQRRDWARDPRGASLGEWRTIPPTPLVILEGVTSSRRDADAVLTCAIWVDAPRQSRLLRGVERDGESMRAAWLDWMEREDAFFAADRTRERADLIVNGAPAEVHDPEHEFVRGRP
jgi:uridine kinase